MRVKVKLLGDFRGLTERGSLFIELGKHGVIGELIQEIAEGSSPEFKRALIDPELDDPRPNALIIVNGREISALNGLDTEVRDGDEVVLISVSHGG